MTLPEPYRSQIKPEWIDYNGHLNEAYYVLLFSHATDMLIDWMGMDAQFREAEQLSVYTLETHICYLSELHAGSAVEVRTRLLDKDDKRLHLYHTLHPPGDSHTHCTGEMIMACVDTTGPKTTAFPKIAAERLHMLHEADRDRPWPARAGRSIALRRRG